MSTTLKTLYGTVTTLSATALATLSAGTYMVTSPHDNTANGPLDLWVEPSVGTTNTPSGDKQILVFAKGSLDNSTFWSGPTTGTVTVDQSLLTYLGTIPLQTAGVNETKGFLIASQFGGWLPPYVEFVFFDDDGVSLTSGQVRILEVFETAV